MLYALEMVGTMAFAVSGVMASRRRRPDFIGAMILAFATAIGGGVIRDAILGIPAHAFQDSNIFYVTLLASLLAIFMSEKINRIGRVLSLADAVGLGLFNSAGLVLALTIESPVVSLPFAVVLGAVTGCGGGIVRDVLCARMPTMLRPREIYISACIVGGICGLVAFKMGAGKDVTGVITAVVTIVIRLLSIRYNWKLPAIRNS